MNFSFEVLLALKRCIQGEKLFDPENPSIIMCDSELEVALNVRALHVSKIR